MQNEKDTVFIQTAAFRTVNLVLILTRANQTNASLFGKVVFFSTKKLFICTNSMISHISIAVWPKSG